MRLEAGDYSGSTVEFLEGTGPRSGEVALSVLNARKLGVRPGQPISMQADGQPVTLTVSGVYQDATSGGYTAKLGGKVTSGAVSYIFYADVGPGVDVDAVASDYAQRFPSSTVFPMARYASQTLSYVTGALRGAALVSCVMGIGVATLITVLFLRLRLTRDPPLVLLMGVHPLRRSTAILTDRGADSETPAAVVERGYQPDQRVTTTRLRCLPDVAESVGVRAPAVIVLGDVVTVSPAWRHRLVPGE